MATPLHNRISELRLMPTSALLPHPQNWRRHPAQQRAVLRSLLQSVGIADALLVYESPRYGGLTILDGHLRQAEFPRQEWPCLVLDVSDAEADVLLATLDPLVGMAETDSAQLRGLLEQLEGQDAPLQEWLQQFAEESGAVPPAFLPSPVDEQARLDEQRKVECPECGHVFTP